MYLPDKQCIKYLCSMRYCIKNFNTNICMNTENKKLRKVVKFTKDGDYIATYKNCYTAGRRNAIKARRIWKCCVGRAVTTGAFIWMFQLDYHAIRPVQS